MFYSHVKSFPFNRSLRALLLTNGLIQVASAMLGPIYALFVDEVGGSLLDASVAGSVFALVAGTTVFLSARYSDKAQKNQYKAIAVGYAVIGIGFLLYTAVNSVIALLAVQALIGLGNAIYSPAFDAAYSEHLDDGQEATEWGAWEIMYYLTQALGALAGGYLATAYGFDALFLAMALLSMISALYAYRLSQRRRP